MKFNEIKTNVQAKYAESQLKSHLQSNWKFYAATAAGLTLGYFVFGGDTVNNTVTASSGGTAAGRDIVTHNHAPKRLSYIVTDGVDVWETQSAAAKALGENADNISNHLNHGKSLASGVNLERLGIKDRL